jgi:NitT/TauT family transport system substrate-binding protein
MAAEKVRVGIPSRSALWWPLFVAEDKKFYESEGLSVETVLVQTGGPARAIQIMMAGDLDFVAGGTITALIAYSKGLPIVMISGLINESPFRIYGVPELNSLKDLKGKTIATGSPGSPPHFTSTIILRVAGLNPEKDVKQFTIDGGNNRIVALEQRQVHATVLPPPFSFRVVEMGFKELAGARDYLREDQNDGIITSAALMKKEPDKARKFLRALTKAMRLIASNREEAIKVLGKYTKQTSSILEKTYDFMVPTISEKISEKGIGAIHRYLIDNAVAPEGGDLKGFVDLRFLPRYR